MRRVYTLDFHFDHSLEELWPILIDTAHLNEATGFPRHSVTQTARPDGSVERIARGKFGPFNSEWEEIPWEWEDKHQISNVRRFRKGIFKSITANLELQPKGDSCRLYGELGMESSNLIGTVFLLLGTGDAMIRNYRKFVAAIVPHLLDNGPLPSELAGDKVSVAVRTRLTQLVSDIEGGPYGHNLARPLAEFVATGADTDMHHIRPLVLAEQWGAEPRKVIELCLEAVRVGLLGMRWDLICPRCRGGEGALPDLESLPDGVHCPSCNIDYQRNFSANVELSFHPSPAIRAINSDETFCLMGPGNTPHVILQKILKPGESAELEIDIAPGAYNLRTIEPGGEVKVDYEGGGFPELIAGDGDDMRAGENAAPGKATLRNESKKRLTLLIEKRDWLDNILTADKVSTLQAFRDLCGNQVLRAGDDAAIEHITLVFSDLRGSTALYNRIGDGPAYHLVREHFAFMAGEVREHNGAIIKTIGDAVMAAFGEPADAVSAMLSIQNHIAAFNKTQDNEELVIKLGGHAGKTIAVNLNGRLDYFGTTVNLAARLQQESKGGDIVLSGALAHDPAVQAIIENQTLETGAAAMKGFDEPIAYTRLRPPA